MLVLTNGTHAEWAWRRNQDGGVVATDAVTLTRNLGCPAAPAGKGVPSSSGTRATASGVLALAAAAAAAAALHAVE